MKEIRQRLQRLLAVLVCVLISLSAQSVEIDGISYGINSEDNTAYVYWMDSQTVFGDVVIPEYITYEGKNYPVVSFGSESWGEVTSITLPSTINYVAWQEYSSQSLTAIYVSPENQHYSSVDGVLFNKDKSAIIWFPKGRKGDYTIPNSVTTIGEDSFYGCSLTSITIPNSVTKIGSLAFYGCKNLNKITLSSSITNVGSSAFKGFDGAMYIEIESMEDWCKNNINFSLSGDRYLLMGGKELLAIDIPNTVENIGAGSFEKCIGIETVNIPNSITSIGYNAFRDCTALKSINISNYVKTIGTYAFYNCKALESARIPSSVTDLGMYSFYGCTALTTIRIPDSIKYIYDYTFYGCSGLTSVTLPNSLTSIGNSAFYGCSSLTSLNIPNSVTSINSSAFYGCTGLASLNIPNSVTSINSSAFEGCTGLASLNIPNSVTSIGNSAFKQCSSLTSLNIPNSVTSIYSNAFNGCSALTSLNIPSSVTFIDAYAFQGCTSLTTVTLPEKLATIGTYAFEGCTKLQSMTLPKSITTLGNNFVSTCKDLYAPIPKIVKTSVSITGKLHVPKGASQIFKDNGWTATSITDDIDMDFLIGSGTYGNVKWELNGSTLRLYGTGNMTATYNTNETVKYDSYPWYSYNYSIKHVIIEGLASLGEGCVGRMYYLETLTTNTTKVNLYDKKTTNELLYCFEKSYDKRVTEGSRDVSYYKLSVPSTLTKIVYTGNTFSISYFTGGEYILMKSYSYSNDNYMRANEFHPTKPLEIHADNIKEVVFDSRKALRNTKLYITYTGTLTSGMFRAMPDLYSLTINGTGVATEAGAFYTLFGYASNDMDMMYGGGDCYIPLNLKEVHLTEGVTTIPQGCFKNVTSLEKVYLPSTLRGVQDNAFLNCDGLTDIYVNAAMPPSAKESSFDGVNLFLCTLHVPYESKQYYSVAKGWKDFFNIDNNADIKLIINKNIENAGQIIGVTSYLPGETTDIKAVPNGGYKFQEWTDEKGNRITTNATLAVEAKESCVYNAIFAPMSNSGTVTCKTETNSIALNWAPNADVRNYKVTLYADAAMTNVVSEANAVKSTSGNEMTATISELSASTTYYYKVVGYGEGDKVLDVFEGNITTDGELVITEMALYDGDIYDNKANAICEKLTYSKSFSTTETGCWNAFYVPMSIDVQEYAGTLDFAEIYAFSPTVDTNGNGMIDADDENFLFVRPVKAGTIDANTPYLIRAHEAKTYTISSSDNILHKAEKGSVEFATTSDKFTVTGMNEYSTLKPGDDNYFVSGNGTLSCCTTRTATVSPNRWIMHREAKKYGNNNSASQMAKEYQIITIGEDMDEADAIRMIKGNTETISEGKIYTLDGKVLNSNKKLQKGLYIQNGKKILVK